MTQTTLHFTPRANKRKFDDADEDDELCASPATQADLIMDMCKLFVTEKAGASIATLLLRALFSKISGISISTTDPTLLNTLRKRFDAKFDRLRQADVKVQKAPPKMYLVSTRVGGMNDTLIMGVGLTSWNHTRDSRANARLAEPYKRAQQALLPEYREANIVAVAANLGSQMPTDSKRPHTPITTVQSMPQSDAYVVLIEGLWAEGAFVTQGRDVTLTMTRDVPGSSWESGTYVATVTAPRDVRPGAQVQLEPVEDQLALGRLTVPLADTTPEQTGRSAPASHRGGIAALLGLADKNNDGDDDGDGSVVSVSAEDAKDVPL